MYLLAPFILQNSFKNSESWFRVMRISTIFGTKMAPFVLNKNFLVQTIVITFIYLLALFIVQNLKKFLQRIQNYDDAPFLGPKWSICSNFFFWNTINIILIYLLAPSVKFKKILLADPELWGCAISGPKMAHFSKLNFFQKTCLVSFSHAYYMPKIKVRY